MDTPSKTYAIARIDLRDAGKHGWQVRLQRRGVKYAKYFSDSLHGGEEGALAVATEWRDRLLSRLETGESVRICRRSARNRSGVVGVSKVTVVSPAGVEYQFWQATWTPESGRRQCVKFSVRRYGDEQAFEMAVEARRKGAGLS